MKLKHFYKIVLLLIVTGFSVSCSKNDDEAPQLSVSAKTVSFEPDGGTSEEITIEANSTWSISNSAASWLQLSKASGDNGATATTITVTSNETGFSRSVVLTVEAANGQARRITITQKGNLYPTYNLTPKAPDETGMTSTAMQLVAKMTMGINFGNTMEAPTEAQWVSSKITESYVKFVKASGFNAVRLPVTWISNHASNADKMKIDPAWLDRVHEVVKWCVENDMYVIVNIHGDGILTAETITKAKQEATNAKQKALWEQIATKLRDFDEHVIFAGANEPPADDAEQMSILNSYYDTFIKAVRATGGKNSYRVLAVQGPHTDPTKTFNLMDTLPTDNIPNKLIVEIHDYTPFQFTQLSEEATWGKMFYYWGKGNHSTMEPERNATHGGEDVIDTEFQNIKQKFVDKGIPVILGEYSAWRRNAIHNANSLPVELDKHNKSVNDWTYYVTKQARVNGIMPFYWETGFVLDRKNNAVLDQPIFDALVEAYK
jgi:aryl-phospho-beta-D-glucosidase BglC (GH1 family)